MENNIFNDASSVTINGGNAKHILLQQSYDDHQHIFNRQHEVDQDGSVSM